MRSRLATQAAQIVKPTALQTPDRWANDHRILPEGSAEPGPWRSSRNPYTIGIVRAFGRVFTKRIVAMLASQTGKTASLFNVIGQRIDQDPAPVIYLGPTQSFIDNVIEPKVNEMLKGVPHLWAKTAQGKKNTKHHKRISGVSLRLAWAGSTTELSSDSAVYGICDELDRMDRDVGGEGAPEELLDARTSTYPDGKVGIISTPTIGTVETYIHPETGLEHWSISDSVFSPIWRLWQEGSRHEWAVPCPECREYFIPRFKLLVWPQDATPEQAEEHAGIGCSHCGAIHGADKKDWMNAYGVYVAPGQRPRPHRDGAEKVTLKTHNGLEEVDYGDFTMPAHCKNTPTFWASGLMSFSPKKTPGYIASRYLRAVRSAEPERVQAVINTDLCELFSVQGEAPDWKEVMDCASTYQQGEVPDGVRLLVCGVDVQKNRLVYVVRGFGDSATSWLIEAGELWGDTEQEDVWLQLDELLLSDFAAMPIARMCIDSGYRKDHVYTFCRLHRKTALPAKGHDALDKPYYSSLVDVNVRGRTIKNGVQLWHFDSDVMKSWVHGRVHWESGRPGAWYLPADISEDYCKQIVAESRVVKASGKVSWILSAASRDNHFLDAEALAYLAFRILGGRPTRGRQSLPKSHYKQSRGRKPVTIKSNISSRFS